MRFRFLPQQAHFFDEFTAMAGRVQDGARLLRVMLGGAAPDHAKADEIRVVEHDCDERTRGDLLAAMQVNRRAKPSRDAV